MYFLTGNNNLTIAQFQSKHEIFETGNDCILGKSAKNLNFRSDMSRRFIWLSCCFRGNDADAIETSSSVNLSPLWVEDAVVGLEAKLPAYGWVRTPLSVSYFIRNHSDQLFTLRLTMEASDAFMFGGQKQVW